LTTSTIDPTQPVDGALLLSAPIRGNFVAAVNDINNLFSLSSSLSSSLSTLSSQVAGFQAAVGVGAAGFTTLAALDADLNFPANTVGLVFNDGTPSNDGFYLKSGASGSGSWAQQPSLFNASILAGTTLASNVVSSSLTSVGTLTALTVSSDINVAGGILIGVGPGGSGNVRIGNSSFLNNTTGTDNVCIGPFTLEFNTSGSSCVAIGPFALQNNTSGVSNLAIGNGALQSNTTGFQCIAIGVGALFANINGIENIAIGVNSMLANTSGQANTACGFGSLQDNISGNSNCAFGAACLPSNTTGSSNVAAGQQAMNDNTTGSSCSAFGFQALFNNQQGNFNSAFGDSSLINVATPASGALSVASSNNSVCGADALFDLGFPSITGATVQVGNSYTIFSIGTTNWVLAGATSNTVGQTFTATATTTGTGTAFANVATNNNSALGYNTGRGIIYGIDNTILGANVTGLAAGLSGAVILASGDGVIHLDFNKTNSAAWTLSAPIVLKTFTVATLPAPGIPGRTMFAPNLRVFNGAGTQQGAGAGTGGIVVDNGTHWVNSDAQSVTAIA